MSDSKKKRMSMLDNLAAATAPAPQPMVQTNRALRSARDAVDGHSLWELYPHQIDDSHRLTERLDLSDVHDLRDAIEANGQTVPILVRRHPTDPDRYLLVYGFRRLEAIRTSEKIHKVKALVANLDDHAATTAQISENMARRDLTFIEKALFAAQLVETGYGSQSRVAEVLTVGKSAISMALAVVDQVSRPLAEAIGPAQGVGRPRWESLGKALMEAGIDPETLIDLAERTRQDVAMAPVLHPDRPVEEPDPSVAAFNAVYAEASRRMPGQTPARKTKKTVPEQVFTYDGDHTGSMKRVGANLRLDLPDGAFADWFERDAQRIMRDLHDRWRNGG